MTTSAQSTAAHEPPLTSSSSSSSCTPPSTTSPASQPGPAPTVHGVDVTPTTQCAHWHSDLDVVAIKHRCCGRYYACISCHDALAGHPAEVWPRAEQQTTTKAVLCGRCRREMAVGEYLACGNVCPGCGAGFNPGCARHYGLYFEV